MNKLHILGGALVGLVVGAAGGYFFAKKQLNDKYVEFADQEIAATKAYLNERHKSTLDRRIPQAPADVDDRVHEGPPTDTLERVLDGLRYGPKTVPVGPPKKMNVFATNDDEEDKRDKTKPYLISVVEWSDTDEHYEQVCYTYYAEDDTLCDDADNIVDGIDNLIGEDHLQRFGDKSGDPHTVFVRNEKLRMDFEIVRTPGSYKTMVLGE
jgi:hypothetical protein